MYGRLLFAIAIKLALARKEGLEPVINGEIFERL
jgi:hypothetical protein